MGLEKRLVVWLPYPERPMSSKCRLFQGDASTISGVTKLRMYLEKLLIREGEDVAVKMFVVHDTPPISFNSAEFATACNDLDGAVSVSCIQASATSKAGYLLGSQKTMNDKHWTPLLNANPRLVKLDVHVVTERIQVNASAPWNLKTDAQAAHVYCAAHQKDQVNKVMRSMYNKKQKWMNMQTSLPEDNIFRYFSYNIKNKIALTP